MSRKHYRALAQALKDSGASLQVIASIAKVLQADNPRFDSAIFFSACGVA